MVFKPSFKFFKNEKINLITSILKLETLLYQNIFISFYHILYIESKQKKGDLTFLRNSFYDTARTTATSGSTAILTATSNITATSRGTTTAFNTTTAYNTTTSFETSRST